MPNISFKITKKNCRKIVGIVKKINNYSKLIMKRKYNEKKNKLDVEKKKKVRPGLG